MVVGTRRWWSSALGLPLVALFIWFAENIATRARAWPNPSQAAGWTPASPAKLLAWLPLVLISCVPVAMVHRAREIDAAAA